MDIIEVNPGKEWRVLLAGQFIGRIEMHWLGSGKRKRQFYEARASDGVEIAVCPSVQLAHQEILDDDAKGRPRDPKNPRMKMAEGWHY